jgi:putative N-acetyltransferase (TIGR04045 family)
MTAFSCRIARTAAERDAYFELRRSIFCDEQGLFAGSDRDQVDDTAHPIICLAESEVVGVVRIWEEEPDLWWGGRLGVRQDHRTVGSVGRWLVQTAVGTALAWGARRFRATVQRPNVPFFRRLHWRSLEEQELHGLVHDLMEADLTRYLPTAEPRPGCNEGTDEAA